VTVALSTTGPDSISTPDQQTDGKGEYSVTLGPFESPGEYDITASVPGLGQQISEGWNT